MLPVKYSLMMRKVIPTCILLFLKIILQKQNGTYPIPVIDRLDEMDTTLNMIVVPKQNYRDGTPITPDTLQMYKPLAYNTEFILGHWRVLTPTHQWWKRILHQPFKDVATQLGFLVL
ncbi:MAG: hypothetical protein U5K79_17850 [Cyclobacteriaceae bacterium]|nr:hypothetical protein [Cyclobacteriaceae bacterium]